MQDLRIYGRALPAAEVARLVHATRAVWLAGKPAGERTDAEKQELFDWWLPAFDKPYRELTARAGGLEQEQARLKSRGSVALRDARAERDADGATCCFAASTTSVGTR